MEKHRSALLAVLFLVVCWYLYGCGSGSSLAPNRGSALRPSRGQAPMLRKFVVTADTKSGELLIRDAEKGEAGTQARPLGEADGIKLTGKASFASGILTGNVTVTSRHPQPLYDVRVVVGSISSVAVTVKNADGTTPLMGGSRPFWSYGHLRPNETSASKSWRFEVPGGTSFTFSVYVFANVWSYARSDGGTLNDVHFIDTSRGWAVGEGGKILVTSDGGATWSPQSSPTRVDLRGVFFVDENRGWAVGGEETILATANGGRQWRVQVANPGSPLALNTIVMAPSGFGWAGGAGGLLLSTENAGRLWLIENAGTSREIYALAMDRADPVNCWLAGNEAFLRTVDGFEWTSMTLPSVPSKDLRGIWFVSATRGFAVGANGTLVTTSDGGTKWTRVSISGTTSLLNAVKFATPQTGWIVGAGGRLLVTRDGGAKWTLVAGPVTSDLVGLACVSGNDAFGAAVGAAGVTLRMTDGQNWQRGGTGGAPVTWQAMKWAGPENGWVVGSGGETLRTANGGHSWTRAASGVTTDLYGVDFVSSSLGWICGAGGKLLKTTNGGATWTAVTTPATSTTALNAVRFINAQLGWVAGGNGTLLYTLNGGSQWSAVSPKPAGTLALWGMDWSADGAMGWIVGASGAIVRSADGGATWTKVTSGTSSVLYDVRMGSAGVGLAVGTKGTILRTTDGGLSWVKITSGVSEDLRAVDFSGPSQAWAAGLKGTILRSGDGGLTWSAVDAGTNRDLFDLRALGGDNLWVAGASGTIRQMN